MGWTKASRKLRGKEMAIDSTFDFEKLRNRPVRYDRELIGATVKSMKRVEAIKMLREKRFHAERMRAAKQLDKDHARREIVQNINLVAPAASRLRQTTNVLDKAKAGLERAKKKSSTMEEE